MSAIFTRAAAAVFVEFTENAAHIFGDERSLDIAIEREPSGALTQASANSVRDALKLFTKGAGQQAFCLLPARGVSIRRISLPANSKEEIERLLPLQIDAQFPLSSEELAWGYRPLAANALAGTSLKELLVAALKKDAVQQYREIISAAGFEPLFVVAALAREGACAHAPRHFALLEVGGNQSELVTFDESGPATLRVVGLGVENASAEPVMKALRSNGAVEKIFVSGKGSAIWSARITPEIPAEPLPIAAGQSSAITGLRHALQRGTEPLLIQTNREAVRVKRAPAQWRWAAAACALLLVSIALRYADPILRRARIRSTIAALEARRAKLPKIDREAAFLNFIHDNEPDYLEVIGALATGSQPGMKLDSLTISRRGEVTFRGQAQGAQTPGTLRSKMLDSGYFANVVIDEQTPNQQNQQQVAFRMTAQLRPEAERKTFLANKPKPDKNATNKTASATGPSAQPTEMPGPPPGAVIDGPPPGAGLPPGVSLPPGGSLPPGVVIQSGPPPQ